MNFRSLGILPVTYFLLSIFLFYYSGYVLQRSSSYELLGLMTALFLMYYFVQKHQNYNFKHLVLFGVLFRLVLLLATPSLSQDFYRFLWDGHLILNDINPYVFTPQTLVTQEHFQSPFWKDLYNGMGALSAANYSNYPPLNQLCFYLAAKVSGTHVLGGIVVLRFIIILADIGILIIGSRLLKYFGLPKKQIFWYFLNPFIIIELTGNLHFEAVMLFFLMLSLYLLYLKKWMYAAITLGLSVATKLIPLLFFPLFFWWFIDRKTDYKNSWRLIVFYLLCLFTFVISFAPFANHELIANYSQTIGLWFQKFEFNASIYYLFRALGYELWGYNIIHILGPLLSGVTFLLIVGIAFYQPVRPKANLIKAMLLAFTIYLFLSTTVHPWYLSTIVLLSVFTTYKYGIVWSFVVVLSYFAYARPHYQESLWLVATEYLIVFFVLFWEMLQKRKGKYTS